MDVGVVECKGYDEGQEACVGHAQEVHELRVAQDAGVGVEGAEADKVREAAHQQGMAHPLPFVNQFAGGMAQEEYGDGTEKA